MSREALPPQDLGTGPLEPPMLGAAVDLDHVYQRTLDRLISAEPNGGYQRPEQVGPLTGVELAAVIAKDESVLCESVLREPFVAVLTAKLSNSAFTTVEQAALVGAALIGSLTCIARDHLLEAVREEIAADEERRRLGEEDARRACEGSAAARSAWS